MPTPGGSSSRCGWRRLLITCPGDYKIGAEEDKRWAELHKACEDAGFTDIEYLHEPVAASYAPVKKGAFRPGQVVLVYDFGGGTFDAAIVRIGPRRNQVVAAGSIPFCGGADIDTLLIEEIRQVTKAGTGNDRMEARLKIEAVEVKKQLSQADPWPVEGPDDGEQRYITRARLNELITAEGLIDKTLALVNRLADDAKVKPDAVLPVGGTTLIPLVKERIIELGYPISEPITESSAVVDGAANGAQVTVYDLHRWARKEPFTEDADVYQLVFMPGGDLIAVRDKGFTSWDPATLSRRWAHDDGRENLGVAPSPDGRLLAVSSRNTTASLRDHEIRFISALDRTLQRTARMQSHSGSGCEIGTYSLDGRLLVPASPASRGPVTWDRDSGLEIVPNPAQKVVALAIRPQDNQIFGSSGDSEISVYEKEGFKRRPESRVRAESSIRSLAFNLSGTLLACGLNSGSVELRRPLAGNLSGAVGTIHTGSSCFFVAFTPDERSLVTGNRNGLTFWNLADTMPRLAQFGT
ncbi:MAG TPA: Hsp70 family protein [Streptosporangiaceae bacterium]|nr:Hsp70 family protein [Streptosporangiaceae bacterium]